MAAEKTEALLVTDRRSFQYLKIVLGEHEIEWKKSIKYLGKFKAALCSSELDKCP